MSRRVLEFDCTSTCTWQASAMRKVLSCSFVCLLLVACAPKLHFAVNEVSAGDPVCMAGKPLCLTCSCGAGHRSNAEGYVTQPFDDYRCRGGVVRGFLAECRKYCETDNVSVDNGAMNDCRELAAYSGHYADRR